MICVFSQAMKAREDRLEGKRREVSFKQICTLKAVSNEERLSLQHPVGITEGLYLIPSLFLH